MNKTYAILLAICLQVIVLFLMIKFSGWIYSIVAVLLILLCTYGISVLIVNNNRDNKLVDDIVEELLKYVWTFLEFGIYLWCFFAILGKIEHCQIILQNAIVLIARIVSYSMFNVHWKREKNSIEKK